MKTVELVVLWCSLAVALYAYVIYPLVMALASSFARRVAESPELDGTRMFAWPKVSLLIATQCEESVIVDRLRNASALNYPADRLEILVGCDGDGDLTALLARSFEDPRVKVVQLVERRGAAAVLNECTAKSSGEVLVFSDVNTMMRPDSLRRLARHFQQGNVGAVCGKLLPIDPTTGRNLSGLVWKFETALSRCEARLGALSRINSGIYAVRKSLYVPLSENGSKRKRTALRDADRRRYELIYDDTAIAVEETPPAIEAEYRARMKSGADARRGLEQLSSYFGARSVVMVVASRLHRRLRRVCPALLLAAFVSNACLSNDPFYLRLLLLHELFYLVALVGLFFATASRWRRTVRVPAQMGAECLGTVQRTWEAIRTLRRHNVEPTATNQAAANSGAR
jgi:Glycosyl transferase family 2